MSSLEIKTLKKFLRRYPRDARILDVACGYGEKLNILNAMGFTNTMGIEKNRKIVQSACAAGLNVMPMDDFSADSSVAPFDIIIMSHIIEHFQYQDLLPFLERYLGILKAGGHLIIATPAPHDDFYDAFDHVKPYHPTGLLCVFGKADAQEQYHSPYILELKDIAFIRLSYRLKYYRSAYIKTHWSVLPKILNRLSHLIYRLSFRTIGMPVSWIGVFELKTKTDNTIS